MNNIIQTIQHTARAATVLLIALLTAQSAWAEEAVTYIDMDGNQQTVTEYTEVTTDMTADGNGNIEWSSGTYVVKSSVTLNGCISFDYPAVIDLIVCDGATLTVNGNELNGAFDGNTLNIYAQSNGTGMGVVNAKKHTSCNQLNIAGGKVTLDDDGVGYGLYVFSGDACGLTVNGGDVTIQNSNGSQSAIYFNGNGFVTLNGGKLTVTNSMGNGYTAIEGNNGPNTINFNGGTAVINGKIRDFKNINLNGGNVTVNGEIYNDWGYTVTYDFTRATDSYYINAFSNALNSGKTRTVQVKDGAVFRCNGKSYSGTLSADEIAAISGQWMTPDVSADFSVNDAGTEYTIHTATGWGYFCDLLADNDKGFFSGKTVQLGADIGTADAPVTRMAGFSQHDFTGTFDGQGNTLTVGYGTADAPFGEQYAAPFRNLEDGCTIKNLHVAGHIYTSAKFAGGLAGDQYGTVSIQNCRSSVTIVSSVENTNNDGTHGGFIAYFGGKQKHLSFEGCVFDGKLLTTNGISHCGGFVGWANGVSGTTDTEVTFTNCLYAPAAIADADGEDEVGTSESATFARKNNNTNTVTLTITNCYYTRTLGDAQGKALHSVTAGDDVTLALSGTATEYTVSGITAYEGNQGIKYGTTYYAGSGDAVRLTLSNTATGDVPAGYSYGYTASAGTLADNNTLTMPDEDVTVSVNTAVLTAIPWDGDGTEGSPYIIKYPSQLDLLAHRVNGTHGETRQTDGYKDTFFKLNNDISYTHTSDWNAFTNDESNFEAIGGYHNGGTPRSFSGHFDGNKKTISGIRIYKDGTANTDKYQGIFGRISSSADIHDLTLADARITGYQNTGGIVGYNYGTVSRCHVAADVAVCAVQSGAGNHGGIAGHNYLGTIEQCTSAAKLTTDDADDAPTSQNYGGIAGQNNRGTLRDNLVIGATVPAAKDNRYGAITGYNDGEVTLQRNYYTACTVAGTENATGVGCSYIDYVNGGYITADVTADAGAVPGYFLTLGEGITIAGGATTITIPARGETAEVTYHVAAAGANVTLSYSGAPAAPAGYRYDGYTASAGTISGSTLTMPAEDVTVSLALRSTGEPVEVSYVDTDGNTQTAPAIALDGTETELDKTWYFVGLPTVAFDHTLELYGDVHLILPDGCTMNVTSSDDNGIEDYGSLTIYGQTDGTGALNATSDYDAGIFTHSGTITISGGTVTATGGEGIHFESGDITISGGRVTATGNTGISTVSGNITISGGRVTATGGAGIYTHSGTITLGCTTASDFIYVSSYYVESEGRLNIADDQELFDEYGISYSDQIYGYNILDGKTLRLSSGIALTARQAPDGNYWTTYYNSDSDFTIDEDENACAYTATYGGDKLTLHKQGKQIPAGTAVIIVAENNVVSMTATFLPAYNDPTNDLRGVDDDTPTSTLGTGTFYVLGMTTVGNEKHFGFHRYTGSTMAAHKAYVLVSGSQALARSLTMVFDEATGIESLTPDAAPKAQAADHWFTLDGRRLQAKPTAPGIYINNGRKVVIK